MRIRSVSPDICIDKKLAEMDDARAERTFVRLWTYCDDDGRARAEIRLIKAAIYPLHDSMTPAEVQRDIDLLAHWELVVLYEIDGEPYLHVPKFSKWQKPNRKVDSKLPPPPPPGNSMRPHSQSSESAVSPHGAAPPVVVVVDVDGDGEVVPPDALSREAHRLTVIAFEQPVVPVLRTGSKSAFVAVLGLVKQILGAGKSNQEIEQAIRDGVEVWTLAGFQTAIAKSKAARAPSGPSRSMSAIDSVLSKLPAARPELQVVQ